MIERVVYVSRAAAGVGPNEVFDLVRRAHNRNSREALTGGLVLLDGHFVQVLEGEPHVLRERLARIAADPRHEAMEVRLREAAAKRRFENDWMALRLPQELDPAVLARFGHQAGWPAAAFSGQHLLDFVHACCHAPMPA